MKDISTIIFRLTVACLLAGLIMGAGFILTNKAKKHNIHVNEQKVMLSLLGYSDNNPAPSSLAMHEVYRYLLNDGQGTGYLIPLKDGGFSFVSLDLDGAFVSQVPVNLSSDKAGEESERVKALETAIGPGKKLRYAEQTIVVTNKGKRTAYLLPGRFPGFKTFINAILALDQNFTILGLDIMEHEEDPGLGAEIDQDYFKGQFTGKALERLKTLEVEKKPLPEDYRQALTAGSPDRIGVDEVKSIREQYLDKDIYALTGATISSRAVTSGVKGMVKKFAYRVAILDRVLTEQKIATAF